MPKYYLQKSVIKLTASSGLTIQVSPHEPLVGSLEVEVGENFPFASTRRYLRVLADMLSKDHQVTIYCPWAAKPIIVKLTFSPPLSSSWKLHTVSFLLTTCMFVVNYVEILPVLLYEVGNVVNVFNCFQGLICMTIYFN